MGASSLLRLLSPRPAPPPPAPAYLSTHMMFVASIKLSSDVTMRGAGAKAPEVGFMIARELGF